MSINLLVLYEIADRASRVTSKKAYREFERWAKWAADVYADSAVSRALNIQLFKLRDQFAM